MKKIKDKKSKKYYPDEFYGIDDKPLSVIKNIMLDAKELSYSWRADILDCSISLRRKKIDISFEDMLSKMTSDCGYVFIHRRGNENWIGDPFFKNRWCLEVGFRTMTSPDYFLWIYCTEKDMYKLIKKYKLKEE